MIELSYLALAIFCLGVFTAGGTFGILIGCCCAVSSRASRREEADTAPGDPWWPS